MKNILENLSNNKNDQGYEQEVLQRLDIFFSEFIEKNGEAMPSEMMRKSAIKHGNEDISHLIDQKVFEIKTKWREHPERINFSNVAPSWDDQSSEQFHQATLNYLKTIDISNMTDKEALGHIMKASRGGANPSSALEAIEFHRKGINS